MTRPPAREAMARLIGSSTPGERWTASLVIVLALALLRFGMPSAPVDALAPPTAGAAAATRPSVGGAVPPAPIAGGAARSGSTKVSTATPVSGSTAPRPPAPLTPGAPPPVVLLLHPTAGTPGRDDAAIVAAFAGRTPFPTQTVDDTGAPGQCGDLLARSHVFVSSDGVEPPLRDCLLAGGAVVIAFDPNLAPSSPDSARLVSTRVPLRVSLADVARVDRARLDGRVGIVTTTELRPEVEAAVDQLRAAGVDVRQVAALPTGPDSFAALAPAVLGFQGAQIDTVVFAAPVDLQSRWAALTSVVRPGTRFVVVDAYDAVINESYAAGFDGAIAITSVRTPWADRAHPTALQASCTQAWQAAAVPPITLGPDEQLRVFEWCQHLDLVARAATTDASTLAGTIRELRVESPLTADLAPLPGDGWGPAAVAELQWHTNCGCWQALRPFEARP